MNTHAKIIDFIESFLGEDKFGKDLGELTENAEYNIGMMKRKIGKMTDQKLEKNELEEILNKFISLLVEEKTSYLLNHLTLYFILTGAAGLEILDSNQNLYLAFGEDDNFSYGYAFIKEGEIVDFLEDEGVYIVSVKGFDDISLYKKDVESKITGKKLIGEKIKNVSVILGDGKIGKNTESKICHIEYLKERKNSVFIDSCFSKKIKIDGNLTQKNMIDENLESISFGGDEYKKYQIEKKEKENYLGIMEGLKKVNKDVVLMKLSISDKIDVNKTLLSEIVEIKDFFETFFDKFKKDIEEGMFHYDKETISQCKTVSETLEIMTEEVMNRKMNTEKGSSYYETFKETNDYLSKTIKELITVTNVYGDEEKNMNDEIDKMIPKNNEFALNSGFNKILETLLDSHKYRRNTILIGHAGFGKTFGCKISSQLLGMPYYKFACNNQTQIEEFFGSISQNEKGIIVREKGPLTKMMEYGGLFVFDEFNSMSQETIKALNGILDTIQGHGGDETINIQISGKDFDIKVHKDFRVCLTGNPVEFMDDYGMLSRVTNDLSRRSNILNTSGDFSGTEFLKESVENFIDQLKDEYIEGKGGKSKIFKELMKKDLLKILKPLFVAVGKGMIQINENNRFFILNKKEGIFTLTNEEAIANAVVPISTLVLLPIKNIIDTFDNGLSSNEVLHTFVTKNLSMFLDMKDINQKDLYEKILKKVT